MTRFARMSRSLRPPRALLLAAGAAALCIGVLSLAGCGGSTAAAPSAPTAAPVSSAAFPITITDDTRRTVTIKSEPKRIVSLAPANTEILFAIGQGHKVVGVTSYDDYPSQVASITKVGDFAGPNIEAVAAAKPDLILATSGVQADVVTKLESLGAVVVVLDPQSLAAVYTDIERVGDMTGATQRAGAVVANMKNQVSGIQHAVAGSPTVTAFIEIGQNPLFTAGKGTLMDELITLAGGGNVVSQPSYVSFSAEQLIKANPDVYFATKGSSADPASIEQRPGYDSLSAVKNKRVVILDDSIVSRGGPRIVEGLRAIATGLHPGAVPAK
jgi:iron complex transport system substrate-binding protein